MTPEKSDQREEKVRTRLRSRVLSRGGKGAACALLFATVLVCSGAGTLRAEGTSDTAPESGEKSEAKSAKESAPKPLPQAERRLTLSDAEELALKNASAVRLKEKDSAIAELDRKIALSTYFPEIAATAGYNYTDPPMGVDKKIYIPNSAMTPEEILLSRLAGVDRQLSYPVPMKITFGALDNYSYGIQMKYILYSGGRRESAVRAAKLGEDASRWLQKDAVRSALHDARSSFVASLLLRKMWDLSRDGRDRAVDRLRDAENRFRTGTISKLELLRARSDASDAELVASESEDRYRAGLDRLKIVIGLPLEEAIEPVGDLDRSTESLEQIDVDRLKEMPPEFAQLEATKIRTRQAGTDVDAKRAAFWPTLSAGLQYNKINPYLGEKKFGDSYVAGVFATFPLFEGGRLESDLKKAKLQEEKARIVESEMQKQLLSYRTLVLDRIATDRKNLGARKENIERARLARDSTKVAQQNGASTLKDLSDSELILFRAEVDYSRAVADMLDALAELERLDGSSSGIFQSFNISEGGGDADQK